ncbi:MULTISPECIES: RDD family protein [Xanthomonas]|uniref:RDD family protein n=1 Tax=Xanthomonas dyei TaxID=743699 RepID=A0ABZ0D6T6_9XANT|nr:RDD family protein [Xanthomonas dyei]MCC4634619.1 RDD family protein [Xanthomonas dyei pv. eucalypti]WOB25959.1 RDD family protein [Xanthomonas dyei]WOB53582.1 RDD family protein [Xanthomonas dyei]
MTQWYYADAQRQRQGPVDTDTLAARLSQGIIDHTSLVWREGLPQWVTLSEVASELGLDTLAPASPPTAADAPVPAQGEAAPAVAPPADITLRDATPVAGAPASDLSSQAWSRQAEPAAADADALSGPGSSTTHSSASQEAVSWTGAPGDAADHPPHTAEHVPAGQLTASAPVASEGNESWPGTPGAVDPAVHAPTPAATAATTPPPPAPAATPLPSAWDTPVAALPTAAVVTHDAPVVYAGLWRRVAASILDSLITTFAVYLIVIPLVFVVALGTSMGDSASSMDDGSALGIAIVVMSYGIGLAIPTLYFAWMQSSRLQASLGKLACGIKVVRADSNGARVGFWRNVLRYLAYMLISVLTLGIGAVVAAFMAGMSQRKQTPHDKICDTLVVDRWAFTDRPELQSRGLDTVSIVVLAIYGVMLVLSIVVVVIMLATIGMSQS